MLQSGNSLLQPCAAHLCCPAIHALGGCWRWYLCLLLQITAGEQIDLMFGAKLGLSSMAAAGLGNTIADVVGINISHTIEVRSKGARARSRSSGSS